MVKNRLLTDALREVRATRSRFLSILLLCALATAFLSGIRNTAPDMQYTADRYFDRTELMDGYVLSTLGVTQEDVEALAAAPGVLFAEGGHTLDATAQERTVIVRSIPERINRYEILRGRDAARADECVTEEHLLIELGLELGDRLTLAPGEGNEDALARRTYTIVGTARSPLYISTDRGSSSLGTGSVKAFVYVPAENFTAGYYTAAFFLGEGLAAYNTYTDEYDAAEEALFDALAPLAEERAQLRYDTLIGEAQDELDAARAEFETKKADAQRELDEAGAQLADARAALDEGWDAYRSGGETLEREAADGERRLDDAEAQLADVRVTLDESRAAYESGMAQSAQGRAEYESGLAQYREGLAQYEEAKAAFDEGKAQYESGLAQYEAGYASYLEGKAELDEGYDQLSAAEDAYEDGYRQLYGSEELASAANLLGMSAEELVAQLATGELPAAEAMAAAQSALDAAYDALESGSADAEATIDELNAAIDETRRRLEESTLILEKEWLLARLERLQTELAGAKEDYGAFVAQQRERIDAAQAELDTLEAGLSAASQGYYALQEAREELDAGWAGYESGRRELSAGKKDLDAAKAQLDASGEQIRSGEAELNAAKAQLDASWEALEEGRVQVEEGEAQLADAKRQLDDGEAQYAAGIRDLAEGRKTLKKEYEAGKAQLADAKRELEENEAAYASGMADYEAGERELAAQLDEAEAQMAQAQRDLDAVEGCDWYVLGRETNVGVVSYSMDSSRVSNLAKVFPLIFFLVAALACLTTMTRMVEEQRTQIGSMKAMGFAGGAISVKYIGYALAASLIGGLAGLAIGKLIPLVIANAFNIMYAVPKLEFQSHAVSDALAVAAAVACTTGAAWWACGATLTATPAALMRPKAPAAGKRVFLERIGPLWRSLSFTWKVTMRNLFRYQKRFWMTVIGIGGCTALIVTGFGLHNSIFEIMDKQFDEILRYDARVGLESHLTAAQKRALTAYLDESEAVDAWGSCFQATVDAAGASRTIEGVTLMAMRGSEDAARFMDLHSRTEGGKIALTDGGVVITEKLSELLNVGVGETIVINGTRRAEATVTGVAENYIQHYIYLTQETYAELMGAAPEENMLLVRYADAAESERVSGELMSMDSVTSYSYLAALRDTFTESMNSIDYAVVIIIVAAAALAFVVLYNLTNINITERRRELATLKVLGFYNGEVSAYVYRENIFLTIFGIALGMVLGRLLHAWMVLTVEVDYAMFGRVAPPHAYVLALSLIHI